MEQQELLLQMELQIGTATLEDNAPASPMKHRIIVCSSAHTHMYLSNLSESLLQHEYLHFNIHSIFTYYKQNYKYPRCP